MNTATLSGETRIKQANSLESIEAMLQSVDAQRTKAAEANTEAGGYAGATEHPVKKEDDRTEDAYEGSRSRENNADVKDDQGAPGVTGETKAALNLPGNQDDVQMSIGTASKATGEDPQNETEKAKAGKDDPAGDSGLQGQSSHPARTDNDSIDGHKWSSDIRELTTLIKTATDAGNEALGAISVVADDSLREKLSAAQATQGGQATTTKTAMTCDACKQEVCQCAKSASTEQPAMSQLPHPDTAHNTAVEWTKRACFGRLADYGYRPQTSAEADAVLELGVGLMTHTQSPYTKVAEYDPAEPFGTGPYAKALYAFQALDGNQQTVAPGFEYLKQAAATSPPAIAPALVEAAQSAAWELAQSPENYGAAVVKRAENEYYEAQQGQGVSLEKIGAVTAEQLLGTIDLTDKSAVDRQVVNDITATILDGYGMAEKIASYLQGWTQELQTAAGAENGQAPTRTKAAMPEDPQGTPEPDPASGGAPPEEFGGGGGGGENPEQALIEALMQAETGGGGEPGGLPPGGDMAGGGEMPGGMPGGGEMPGGMPGGGEMPGGLPGGGEMPGGMPGGGETPGASGGINPEELAMLAAALQQEQMSPEMLEAGAGAKAAAELRKMAATGRPMPTDWRPKTAQEGEQFQHIVNFLREVRGTH